jgi:HlyD family secretion protein
MKGLLFILFVFLGLFFWFQDDPLIRDQAAWVRKEIGIPKSEAAIVHAQYITIPAEIGHVHRSITATGTLNSTVNVEVGSQLSGQITEVIVDFNDSVVKNQPLARLDQKSFQAKVDEAEATLSLAKVNINTSRAKVERAETDVRDSAAGRAVLKARADSARITLESAQNALRRKETLQTQGIGTAADLEDVRSRVALAAAALRETEALEAAHEHKIAASKADLRRSQSEFDAAVASVPQREALLHVANIDLDRTTIRSPIEGVVVGRNVNEGQTLATTMEAKTVFIIAGDLHEMEIHAKVDEADIGRIRAGQEAFFTVDAQPGRQFTASVRQLRKAPQVQQNVVTYTVVLTAANRDNLLLPGMTALVRITVNRTGPVLKVPLAALRFAPRSADRPPEPQSEVTTGTPASVWVLGENGKPKGLAVGIGEDDSSQAAVVSGALQPGDRVIIGEVAENAPNRLFGIRLGL